MNKTTMYEKDVLAELNRVIEENERLRGELSKSKELLNAVLNNESFMLWVADENGADTFINKAWLDYAGCKMEDCLGDGWQNLLHPDDLQDYLKSYKKAYGNREKFKHACRMRSRSGEYRWFEGIGSPLVTEGKEFRGYLGSCIDVTERINAERTQKLLRESKELVESIVETANVMIIVVDMDSKIQLFNKTAEDITGYSREEVIGRNCFELIVPGEKYPNVKKNIENWFKGVKAYRGDGDKIPQVLSINENPILTKSGEEKYISWRNSEICKDGTPVSMISFGTDITEQKKMEELEKTSEENIRLLNEARQYNEIKTEFFANISHELRTPLNVILGSVQLLGMLNGVESRDEMINKLSKYTGYMKQNCYRLLRLVNNLIDVTKMDSGYFDIKLKNRNIIGIVEDITLSIAQYVENKNISLIFDTDVEEKIIACDPDKIERIVLNLLSNSIKFTEPGGLITVSISDKESEIVISVKDTGIGIPENNLEYIFERFRQVNKSFIRDHEGSGIGLSIVKSIVELHGGRVSVSSKIGEGSEFVIHLPCKTVDCEQSEYSENYITKHSKIERVSIEFSDIYS
jgi:PAS domain S-box-containing protein